MEYYNPNYIYLIIPILHRPFTRLLFLRLENEIPNKEDELYISLSYHCDIPYMLIGFKQKYLDLCNKICYDLGLNIKNGRPVHIYNKDNIKPFPFNHSEDLIYTIHYDKSIFDGDLFDNKYIYELYNKENIKINDYLKKNDL